ncbi:MAG: DUF2339 domain-containing protein, partial [Verrucomicrobiota bacterium]|nr:DUF2339 domain-containing protein [Verrucomicrobiota bacterium]
MDSLNALLFLGAAILIVLPLALHLWHLRSSRHLRRQVAALQRRIAALETSAPLLLETPPPLPMPAPPAAAPSIRPPRAALNLENAIGVKLFAWLGGLALFVGVLLAVRYAFENDLITPGMRVAGGAVVGLALIGGGLLTAARRFHAPAFSMCATGILVLYGDIYAAHAYYNLLPLAAATVLMTLVSAAAFLLALRLDAQVIVVLGMLGGFLTPALLWSTSKEPLPLFTYAALLNAGVAAVALRKRWDVLILLAAVGTLTTEFVWLTDFFDPWSARTVFLLLGGQFLAISLVRDRREPTQFWSVVAAAVALIAGILAAFIFVNASDARVHAAGFVLPFVFACNLGVILLAIGRSSTAHETLRNAIAATALAFTWALEWSWHEEHFTS